MKIIFYGTPGFASFCLEKLIENNLEVVAVVTAPDRPSGRGLKNKFSEVKVKALEKGLKILQPLNLKSEEFQDELRSLNPDLQIVIAFRMLPRSVWELPKFGTFNLHASLLPKYRGAAPINWAIINGEKETGVTTFFINNKIDEGNILFRKKVEIKEVDTAGSLHDKLMIEGAQLVIETVQAIEQNDYKQVPQDIDDTNFRLAPKIFKEDCKINWDMPIDGIYNFVRGMSPYPAAWTVFEDDKQEYYWKIFSVRKVNDSSSDKLNKVEVGAKNLKISVDGGYIEILEAQIAGKKRMKIQEILNGFSFMGSLKIK